MTHGTPFRLLRSGPCPRARARAAVAGATALLAVCASGRASRAAADPFPADADVLNVKSFGAVGNGVHDDTAAFNAALSHVTVRGEHWHVRIVEVPAGTYRISDTLSKHFPEGGFDAGFVLIGEGRGNTILRLDERAPGFGDPAHAKAVIYTSGKGFAQAPKGGYALRGEGNDGFSNFVENLTVDVGEHNPGAIGIDYLANNQGAIRGVTVTGAGSTGIAMTRRWFGPGLLEDVTVNGFDVGIDIANLNYSVTIDNLTLTGQRRFGLRNEDNLVAIHSLVLHTKDNRAEVPLANVSSAGMLVIDRANLDGATASALRNDGLVHVRRLTLARGGQFLGTSERPGAVIDGVYQGDTRLGAARPSWGLDGAEAPVIADTAPAEWASVRRFAATGNRYDEAGVEATRDAGPALRAAFNSGAATVYLPFGVYEVRGPIDVPPSVHHIAGMHSTIQWAAGGPPGAEAKAGAGVLRTRNSSPLLIDKLYFSFSGQRRTAVEHAGSGALVLRDIVGMGAVFRRDAAAGELFLNNVSGGFLVDIAGPAPVYGRQINSEGGGARGGVPSVRIADAGAPMWLLGVKSEGNNTLVAVSGGGTADLLGVMAMPLTSATVPLFSNNDSRLTATGVELAFKPDTVYPTVLAAVTDGNSVTVSGSSLPPRPKTQGSFLPRLLSGGPSN